MAGKFAGFNSFWRRVPPVTFAIVAINVAIFLYEQWLGSHSLWKERAFGLKYALSLDGLKHGYYWKLITFQFLHGGWLHLLINCCCIFMLGPPLEATLGRARLGMLYLLGGVMGGALQVVASLISFERFGGSVVGASAGVFGLVSAFAFIFPEALRITANRMLAIVAVITIIGIIQPSWLLGMQVAHTAHMGGLIGGFVIVRLFMQPFRQKVPVPPPVPG